MERLATDGFNRFLGGEILGSRSHPRAEQLERLMRGELSRPEVLLIVRHMMRGCTECLKVTRPLWKLMQEKPKPVGGRR